MELKKILLVEDDPAVNYLSRFMLSDQKIKCRVDEVIDGRKAMDYIAATTDCPDVIFLDINMPVMDGLEFLKRYNEQGKCCDHTQVFMLTSSDNEQDKNRSMQYDFVKGYFEKPLTESHVNAMLASLSDH